MVANLERSVHWTCWFNAWIAGCAPLETALDAVNGDDTAHHVLATGPAAFLGGEDGEAVPLLLAWGALRRTGATAALVALPAPGDPFGLAGPAGLTAAATDAGEAVLVVGTGLGLVPEPIGRGVFWTAHEAVEPRTGEGLAEASRQLRTALSETTRRLLDLDVARWQPEVREALAGIRESHAPLLAPGYDPRAEQLAATALRCLAITDVASGTASAAVTGWEAASRDDHLRTLARAARHGLVAACNAGRPR